MQIKARPGEVPAVIEVDVSALEIGDSLRVSDVSLPEGVTTEVDPEAAVAIAHPPRAREPEAARSRASRPKQPPEASSQPLPTRAEGRQAAPRHPRRSLSRSCREPTSRVDRRPPRGRARQSGPRVRADSSQRRRRGRALIARRHSAKLRPERGTSAETVVVRIGGRALALAVPQTYVNDSGLAVRALVRRYLHADAANDSSESGGGRGARIVFAPSTLVIVHDELDLEPGVVRVKIGGGTAGHNGLRSIQSHLRHLEFARVRIGVGKPPNPAAGADYVLRRASRADRALLDVAVEVAADAVECLLLEGPELTLNRFNTRA